MAPLTGALVPYMVLEWLEGRALAADLEVRRAYGDTGRSMSEMIAILDPAAEGLAYAHANGVVHRDVNPGNLFLSKTSRGISLKVLDFGVAKVLAENALAFGPRVSTIGQIRIFSPPYAAPEQFDDKVGAIGPWTDVYSFALIAIEILRDRPAVEGEHLGDFASRALDPLVRPSPRRLGVAVAELTEQIFVSAVALKPNDRPQDVGEFWGALKNAIQRDAAEGNLPYAEPPPGSGQATSALSSSDNTEPKMKVPLVTTLALEKVPLPIRPTESVVSLAPHTPTKDIPIALLADEYLAGEPPTKIIQSPLEELPPQTARMADAPAREAPRPVIVTSGAGALAAAFDVKERRVPAILAATRPSAGNEPFMRPSDLVGARPMALESAAPRTSPATEVKLPEAPAPIPNVFEERRRASDPSVPAGSPVRLRASDPSVPAGPPVAPTPAPVPVGAMMHPMPTGAMTVVAVPFPGPAAPPDPMVVQPIPLGTAFMARPAALSNTPPPFAPSPSHAASQPPPNDMTFPLPTRPPLEPRAPDSEGEKPTRIGQGALASMSPLYTPPKPPEARPPETPSMSIHIPKKSGGALAIFLVFFVLLVLSGGAYVAYAWYRARHG
jgi:hypothetical protein